jgi:hypothetical protein
MAEMGVVWPSVTNSILSVELGMAIVFLMMCVFASSRKQEFI